MRYINPRFTYLLTYLLTSEDFCLIGAIIQVGMLIDWLNNTLFHERYTRAWQQQGWATTHWSMSYVYAESRFAAIILAWRWNGQRARERWSDMLRRLLQRSQWTWTRVTIRTHTTSQSGRYLPVKVTSQAKLLLMCRQPVIAQTDLGSLPHNTDNVSTWHYSTSLHSDRTNATGSRHTTTSSTQTVTRSQVGFNNIIMSIDLHLPKSLYLTNTSQLVCLTCIKFNQCIFHVIVESCSVVGDWQLAASADRQRY